MYEYLPIEQIKVGSIIERIGNSSPFAKIGKLYIVLKVQFDGTVTWLDELGHSTSNDENDMHQNWKLVKTKPGFEAKLGDLVVVVGKKGSLAQLGSTHIVTSRGKSGSVATLGTIGDHQDFLVLCKPEGNPFKVGDRVRYIGPPDNIYRPSFCTVKDIYENDVYYTKSKSCHYKFWELIPEESTSPVDNTKITLHSHKNFVVGQQIRRIGYSVGDLPIGYITTLLGFTEQASGIPRLYVKDTRGKDRRYSILSAWEPYDNTPEADESQHPTNTKENSMNPEKLAACISKAITEETKKVKVKTDFQTRKKLSGVIYNAAGKYITTIYTNKAKKLEVAMQQPEYLGMTMVTHEAKSTITTNIPLVITDLKN